MSDTTTTSTTKPWWASKTIWVNIIAGLAAVAGALGFELPAEQVGGLTTGVLAVVNIILRLVTSKKVTA